MGRAADPNRAWAVRVRAYQGTVLEVKRTFRVPADADLAAFVKRCALAALPKSEGWHLLVVSVERTGEDEHVAAALDRLARRHMAEGGRDFVAALAATADGGRAVLAVNARDTAVIEGLREALAGKGR